LRRDSFVRGTWRIRICDQTHLFVLYVTNIYVTSCKVCCDSYDAVVHI